MKRRSRGARAAALGCAVTLLTGGVAGLAVHTPIATKVGAVLSIIAGLYFLRIAAGPKKETSGR